ncbi:hypothetical protein AVEN_18431-1 [Araneus ventricosus]|uniref:Uncharacterized protein n=1 Tax=Araneus ventricosus TaxID=182803 RepID=A0A4Y2G500_ARAVE|nr:hypothetical protein AVEN_18431-1 [Araneus ventricosus]
MIQIKIHQPRSCHCNRDGSTWCSSIPPTLLFGTLYNSVPRRCRIIICHAPRIQLASVQMSCWPSRSERKEMVSFAVEASERMKKSVSKLLLGPSPCKRKSLFLPGLGRDGTRAIDFRKSIRKRHVLCVFF